MTGMTAKQVRELNPFDLETMDECSRVELRLTDCIADMEGQQLQHLQEGTTAGRDGDWLRRLTYALKTAKGKRLAVQQRRAAIRRQDMGRAGIVLEKVLREVAQGMMTPDQFTRVMEAAKERISNEMQG